MKRRFFLIPLLAVALVGFAKGQGTSEKEDVAKKEVLELEEQFLKVDHARDRKAMAPLLADGFTAISERWGRGEVFNKAQYLDLRTSPRKDIVFSKVDHEDIKLHVFGNTVVMTGLSKSILRYKGKISKVLRVFSFVCVKQHGRWQFVLKHISDVPNGV